MKLNVVIFFVISYFGCLVSFSELINFSFVNTIFVQQDAIEIPKYYLPYSTTTKELLCDNNQTERETPRQYINRYNEELGKIGREVVLGISIINYSAFKLEKFAIFKDYIHYYNRIVHGKSVTEINPYTEYFFIMDNNNNRNYGIYGSLSMDLILKNHERKTLALRFDEPYR